MEPTPTVNGLGLPVTGTSAKAYLLLAPQVVQLDTRGGRYLLLLPSLILRPDHEASPGGQTAASRPATAKRRA